MRLNSNKEKERERYYLLPGQGGRARQRKVRSMILWGLLAGLFASLVVALILYLLSRCGKGVL